jgi:hypothetical protein
LIVDGDLQRASMLCDYQIYKKRNEKENALVVVVGISGGIDKVGTPEREMPHSSELTLFIQASPKRLHVSLLTANELLTLLFP